MVRRQFLIVVSSLGTWNSPAETLLSRFVPRAREHWQLDMQLDLTSPRLLGTIARLNGSVVGDGRCEQVDASKSCVRLASVSSPLADLLRSRYAPIVEIRSSPSAPAPYHGLPPQTIRGPRSVFNRRLHASALDSAGQNLAHSFCTARQAPVPIR